jgi:hypothetical protein
MLAHFVLLWLLQSQAIATGTAHVRVIDDLGAPIRNAKVLFIPHNQALQKGSFPQCFTNEDGECTQDNLLLTEYWVSGSKDEDGYPGIAGWQHMPGLEPATFVLNESDPAAEITLPLKQKGGMLVIRATDAVTGDEVKRFNIFVCDPVHRTDNLSTGRESGSGILLPSDEDLEIEILAPGYEMWKMKAFEDARQPKVLRLSPDQTIELQVRLQPQPSHRSDQNPQAH